MRTLPVAAAALAAILGLLALWRTREASRPSDSAPFHPEPAISPIPQAEIRALAPPDSRPSLAERFENAQRRRDWAEVRRIKSAVSEADIEALLHGESPLLAGELLENLGLDASRAEALFSRLTRWECTPQDRALWLRLVVRFGGEAGSSIALQYLRDDSDRGAKRDAALALGAHAREGARAALEAQAQGGWTGVFSVLALERMHSRGAIRLDDARRLEMNRLLEREIELGDEVVSVEALNVLTAIRATDQGSLLIEFLRRPESSASFRRRALALWAGHGTEEDLEKLPSAPLGLEAEYDQARRTILSRSAE